VGDSRKRKINIRIITATHGDLLARVREGLFREDLYYRLKVFPIHLPPLRKRREDIPLLADHFIRSMNRKTEKKVARLSQEALRIFMDHPWPGNVRELENAIEHAFVLCNRDKIEVDDLPLEIRHSQPVEYSGNRGPGYRVRGKLTKTALMELLGQCDWSKAEVGRQIGRSHTAVWKYMKKWNIPLKQPP